MKEAYAHLVPTQFSELDIWNEHELNWLLEAARNRDDIFETKTKPNLTKCFCTPNHILDQTGI